MYSTRASEQYTVTRAAIWNSIIGKSGIRFPIKHEIQNRILLYRNLSPTGNSIKKPWVLCICCVCFRFGKSEKKRICKPVLVNSGYDLPIMRAQTMMANNFCLGKKHSRPQSPRFFWSRGRRNGGLWTQPLPDVRNFLTSVSACVVAFNTTAHAHMLILREGEGREFIVMADREKMSTKRSRVVDFHLC